MPENDKVQTRKEKSESKEEIVVKEPTSKKVVKTKRPPTEADDEDEEEDSGLISFARDIIDHEEEVTKLINVFGDKFLASRKQSSRFKLYMAILGSSVITIIILVSGGLTFYDKIDGSTFAFLLGLIGAYMLTFVKDSITGGR